MSDYYLYVGDQVQGPYSEEEIKSHWQAGYLPPETQVSVDGATWQPLSEVLPGLLSISTPPPIPARNQPTVPAAAPEEPALAAAAASPAPLSAAHKGIGRLAFFGISVVLAVISQLYYNATHEFLVGTLLFGGLGLCAIAERLSNIGRHPAWCFLALVSIIGLFVTMPAFLLPPGYQQHRKLDLPAKIIASLLLALFAFFVIGILMEDFR